MGALGALGTAMTGSPVARIAAGTRPTPDAASSVFVVVSILDDKRKVKQ